MSWFAILLALASLGGAPSKPVSQRCKASKTVHAAQKHCKAKQRPKAKVKPRVTPTPTPKPSTPGSTRPGGNSPSPNTSPGATPTPTATSTPPPSTTATPVPTATPVYPTRTGVDLGEWYLRSSYLRLAAGNVDFNAANLGEDDHNLSIRGGGKEYGRLDLSPGDAETLTVRLPAGSYTLYCSLQGHEEQGMRTDITVR